MKKLTAILLAFMLILSVTPTALAAVYTEGYLHYTVSDESITVTGYFGDAQTVTIPAMIAGIPVKTIASGAFTGSGIKVLNLPDTITGIEGGAIDPGVVINYNSTLPSGGQEQPDPTQSDPTQPDPTQPDPTRPDPTQPDSPQPDPSQPDPPQPDPTQPDPTRPASAQPDPTRPAPTQPDDRKPQPEQPTASTEPAIEEVEIELEETAAVMASQEIPDPTKETEAEAVTEPAASKPFAAAIAAVPVLGGVLVWKKKK